MKKNYLSDILLNVVVCILGVLLIIWSDNITNIASILLGTVAVFYGIIGIVNYFRSKNRLFSDTLRLIYGIIVMIVGFILIFRVDFLKELISFVVGIYIVIASIIQLQEVLMVKNSTNTKMTSGIVLSFISLLVGILCIIGKFLIPDIIIMFIGIMLVIYSICNTVNLFIIRK